MNKLINVLACMTLLSGLASCGNEKISNDVKPSEQTSSEVEEGFQIKFVSNIPDIEPYKDFDVNTLIIKEEGATYEFEGAYLDSRNREKEITFNDGVINIPENDTVAEIVVTATKDNETITKDLSIGVVGVEDVIDKGMIECWAEDSIARTPNFNPEFIKEGNSSVKVTFGGFYSPIGIQYTNLNAHLSNNDETGIYDYEYLSIYKEADVEKAYKDAVICMWVYNAMKEQSDGMDDSLYFAIRIKESPYSNPSGSMVDVDWGQTPIIEAKRGEWTLVYWYLKDMGKTTDFYKDLSKFYSGTISNEEYRNSYDAIAFKVLGKNVAKTLSGEFDTEVKYTFTFYYDKYDIMSRAQFEATYGEYLDK